MPRQIHRFRCSPSSPSRPRLERKPQNLKTQNRAHPIAPSAAADALRSVAGTSSSKLLGAGGAGGAGGASSSKKGAAGPKKGSAAANAAAAAAAAVAKIRGRKRRKGEAVTWQLRPFENAARGDEGDKPLKLVHWVKCLFPAKLLAPPPGTPAADFDFASAAAEARAAAAPADGGAPYPFAAFNKRPRALRYDDDEWASVVPPAQGWDREESDYLLDMLDRFGLRFHVVADRYKVRREKEALFSPPPSLPPRRRAPGARRGAGGGSIRGRGGRGGRGGGGTRGAGGGGGGGGVVEG